MSRKNSAPVGYAVGTSFDLSRPNWDGDGPRPLKWTAWYPAADGSVEEALTARSWFHSSPVAVDAPMRESGEAPPLVLLSHGAGGVGAGLEWLAHRLAGRGFVALAVDHHGNTGSEPRRAEGFLCPWERAADFSALLDDQGWRQRLRGHLSSDAFVAGFSAGANAAMLAVGARVAYSLFEPGGPAPKETRGPREFPNLADHIPRLLETSEMFRDSWDRRRGDFRDPRFKAALALAPGRSVLGFDRQSLADVQVLVRIIVGDADAEAPAEECADRLHRQVPGSDLEIIGTGVGHYAFLPEPTEFGLTGAPVFFTDAPGVDRRDIHDRVARSAAGLFRSATQST
jgi:predicted dienelactone hydrolase